MDSFIRRILNPLSFPPIEGQGLPDPVERGEPSAILEPPQDVRVKSQNWASVTSRVNSDPETP